MAQIPSAAFPVPAPEKSSQLLIREHPHRTIAIASSSHALIFRHSPTTSEAIANGALQTVPSARPRPGPDATASKCMVEFSPASNKVLQHYRPLTPRPIYGTLGLISIGQDVFVCVITQASRVATLRPGETVERILSVDFFCVNSSEYDDVFSVPSYDQDFADNASTYNPNLSRREIVEHPCQELQKLLSNGTFYYSTDFDVTNRLQDRSADADTFDIDNFDESFLWNLFMIKPLVLFRSRLLSHERKALDNSRFLTSAIRGYCCTMTIPQLSAPLKAARSGLPSYLTVISRLSCKRAGTRFNSRGIDDDGNVANFVETETIYWSPGGLIFSYAQVRGSVPVFWEQAAGLIPGQQKITITRSRDAMQPAFNKHFEDLEESYGAVHIVNLLSKDKPGEVELTQLYQWGVKNCPMSQTGEDESRDHALLRQTQYDFHAETRAAGYESAQDIRHYLEDSADGFAYYLAEESEDPADRTTNGSTHEHQRYVVVLQQEGVFRTNCLDCLDRTNLIQSLISQMAVQAFLNHRGELADPDFYLRHSSLWADNGDALSKIYAGTGALKSSFTRSGKMSLAGALADARKSATRLYINNFADKGRQNTIDLLLGRLVGQSPVVLFDPINDYVNYELQKRGAEFSSTRAINLWVGTFNLNGRTTGIDEDLSPWLWPPELGHVQPDVFVVGFQEIVELSPQQIMNSDPTRKHLWERAVKKTLNNHTDAFGGERYVLLRSGQLVGAALCIFVKASLLGSIKNVEGSVKKTGMSGMAGNKGAVAIRFDFANTPICFVTAHLAAGFANYDERNRDFATIHHGLRFQRNRGIDDHDTVIWLGDFNYRIGLSSDAARELVRRRDFEQLYGNDQLNLQMVAGLAFPFYSEARIAFMPTYKFDVGRDEYDTSEKARIPAWTDRILRKGTNIRQLSYNSAPLRFSDHRPVYATFECSVNIVDEQVRDKISHDVYIRRKADVGDATANINTEDTDDEDLIGYDPIEPGLPPASSDRQKWWLENGKPARSAVAPPRSVTGAKDSHSAVLNPHRPSNPFVPTDEPDWVKVPSARSRLSSFSSLSSSPYEHISSTSLPSSSAAGSAGRRLPPPFDQSALAAKAGRLNLAEQQATGHVADTVPPPPPPRRQPGGGVARAGTMPVQSTMQPTHTFSKQPPPKPPRQPESLIAYEVAKTRSPPPIARKPAHLLSPAASPSVQQASEMEKFSGGKQRPQAPRRPSTHVHHVARHGEPDYSKAEGQTAMQVEAPPPKPPRRANTQVAANGKQPPAGSTALPGMGNFLPRHNEVPPRKELPSSFRPPPPGPRPNAPPARQATQGPPVDLLGDEVSTEMQGWETLKPS